MKALRGLPALSVALSLVLMPSLAAAGPLATTARGVDHKSSSDESSSSSTTTVSHDDVDRERDTSWYDESSSSSSTSTTSTCTNCSDSAYQLHFAPPSLDLRLAAQKVRDSDGSFRLDAELRFGRVGIYIGGDHYYEHIEAKAKFGEMSEDVRVNLFEMAATGRFVDGEVVKADLRLGFAGAASSHFDTIPGGAIGMRLSARANKTLALSVEGRAMAFKHDIVAFEAAAGAHISHAWLGYRALKFDVGPVLEGPEAGVRFEF